MFAIPPVGVLLVGAAFWLVGYLALGIRVPSDLLTRLFVFGALSIPLAHVLDELLAAAFVRFVKPAAAPPPARGQSRVASGVMSARSAAKVSDDEKQSDIYYRDLKIHAVVRVVFIALLYALVAKGTKEPTLILVAGSLLFALALPQNVFRFWARHEAPDSYQHFIYSHGSLPHRALIAGGALAVQFGWMMFA